MVQILQETPHWVAVYKPTGVIVENNPWENSVETELVQYLSQKRAKPFLGIVHRLDKVTSGVLLLAKKKSTLKYLNEQFRLRQVQKTYLALVEKKPAKPVGKLVHWLRKDFKNKRALLFEEAIKETKKCELTYRFLKETPRGFLLEIKPKTGKYHQIRAQLSAINCPIIGDKKYGATTDFGKNAIALHAWKLTFEAPDLEEKICIEAEKSEWFVTMNE